MSRSKQIFSTSFGKTNPQMEDSEDVQLDIVTQKL